MEFKRTAELIETLELFVKVNPLYESSHSFAKQVIGKKYEITPMKLLKRFSVVNQQIDENRTFFCSELVAAVYKQIGLVDEQKAATQYWPGSFSVEENIPLLQGAKFSMEYVIDFQM